MRRLLSILLVIALAAIPFIFTKDSTVKASVSITSPVTGACYKGGSSVNITWTSDDSSYDHGYVSYDDGSGYPTYPDTGEGFLYHPTAADTVSWTVPAVTASNYRVYVESHSGGHAVLSYSLTGTFSIDSSGPSAPTLSVSSKTTTNVSLSWTASSDVGCKGLAGYKVFRNNQQIATTTSTTYQDSGLVPSTSYQYHIEAYDAFASANSNNISATTDAEAPASNDSSDEEAADTTKPDNSNNSTSDSTDTDTDTAQDTPTEDPAPEVAEEEAEEKPPETIPVQQNKVKARSKLPLILSLSPLGLNFAGTVFFLGWQLYRTKKLV